MSNEQTENDVMIQQLQVEALNECGYNISRDYTIEQLNSFVQAETLKTMVTIKKFVVGFGAFCSISLFLAFIVSLAVIFQ